MGVKGLSIIPLAPQMKFVVVVVVVVVVVMVMVVVVCVERGGCSKQLAQFLLWECIQL